MSAGSRRLRAALAALVAVLEEPRNSAVLPDEERAVVIAHGRLASADDVDELLAWILDGPAVSTMLAGAAIVGEIEAAGAPRTWS